MEDKFATQHGQTMEQMDAQERAIKERAAEIMRQDPNRSLQAATVDAIREMESQ